MARTGACLCFLTCAAMMLAFHCRADLSPPPPSNLLYEWEDVFKVNVSWERPRGLLADGVVRYIYMRRGSNEPRCILDRYFTNTCFTDEMDADGCTFEIWTVAKDDCETNVSTSVSLTIDAPKPRAKLVTDFKCFIYPQKMNCNWIPLHASLNLMLSYRESNQENVTECNQLYSSGQRNGCYLPIHFEGRDIFILVDSDTGMQTLKPPVRLPTSKLNIREEGGYLKLTWTPPEMGRQCGLIYKVHYEECNVSKEYEIATKEDERKNHLLVPYNNRCLYRFWYKVMTNIYCPSLSSDFSKVVSYGSNKPPDRSLTVVAIVIPTILSICVFLSCYCFRRHSAIICPIIPDPSVIFKEMMMNGNKEHMPKPGSLYTPVPEPIEHISIATEESTSEQSC